MADKIFVTFTCKNTHCRKAFVAEDVNNCINEIPLDNKLYCPECIKKGFGNAKTTPISKKEVQRLMLIKQFIKENNLNEKDGKFISSYVKKKIKEYETTGKKIVLKNLFKNALEVLEYKNVKDKLDKEK